MLKYNFKMEKRQNKVQEIECDSLYLSDDLTYISGITSPQYNLVDGQTIYIAEDGSTEFHPYPIQIFECEERGYVVYPQQIYAVSEYDYFGETYRGFTFADSKTYIADGFNKLSLNEIKHSLYWAEITTGETIDLSDSTIQIDTKYRIYNSIVTINGIDYEVDFDDGNLNRIQLNDGNELDLERLPKAEKRVKFFIRKKSDYKVNVEHISFTSPFKYVLIDELEHDEISGKDFIVKKKRYLTELIDEEELDNISDTLNYNGETMQVFTEWRDIKINDITENDTNTISVYLDDRDYSFKPSDIIKVTNYNLNSDIFFIEIDEDNQKFVKLYGIKYYVKNDNKKYISYNGKEYELLTENGVYYIIVDDSVVLLEKVDDSTMKRVITLPEMSGITEDVTYPVIVYEYIVINKINYLVRLNEDENKQYIIFSPLQPIKLSVSDVNGSNRLRCTFLYGDYTDIDDAVKDIVANHQNYIFELENKLFDEGNVGNIPSNEKEYSTIKYKLYKSIDNINLRLNLNNRYDAKLHQEFVQERDFFEVERRKAINDIVDMEKDIYYPATKDGNSFINVDKIIIDLHFRSRNLDDWKINNSFHNSISEYDSAKCNWNIIDSYDVEGNNQLKPKIEFSKYKYYQPSDLLYFLNFTDDDIFYQKDKVGKSFLRLSYYDSPNVKKQSLLASSTVFVSEGELYKKFINNRVEKGNYMSVNEIEDEKDRFIGNNISINFEPIDKNKNLTFNEDERLSSSFVIRNKYESVESSEGFYLYLFKNYSNGMRDNTIYLKVEFNHAGVGRTLTFMQPYKMNGETRNLLDLSDSNDLNRLKKGCTLQEMYNWIFIPIKVKYDFESKRYYYYLPEGLIPSENTNQDKSTMRFNLYELKIADETKN